MFSLGISGVEDREKKSGGESTTCRSGTRAAPCTLPRPELEGRAKGWSQADWYEDTWMFGDSCLKQLNHWLTNPSATSNEQRTEKVESELMNGS